MHMYKEITNKCCLFRDQQWTNYYQLPIMSNQVPAMNQWY
jgi:hypothetical protein